MIAAARIAFDKGKIVAQMIGLNGKPSVPHYYVAGNAAAFARGFVAERGRMERRVERTRLA